MTPEPSTVATPDPPPRKRRGILGFLFKSVLGCSAFALGSLVVFVLLLPQVLEPLARSYLESSFGETFKGSLEVEEVDLSWKSEQSIREMVLYDPEHGRVASASAKLPSILRLLSSGPRRWAVAIELDADLVADDQGVTNLERAIEPWKPAADPLPEDVDARLDWLEALADLDLDLQLSSRRLSWSDVDTRRAGIPFEVRDLAAALEIRPGQPIALRASGQVVSDSPGAIEVDATLRGPIEKSRAWPFGEVDAKARIEGFSSAMVDGIAGLRGNLKEMLGPRFDLRAEVRAATPDHGDLEIELASERTNVKFAGRFAEGALRAAGDSSVRATIGVPRGFVAGFLAPVLPQGTQVAWEESQKPWTVTLSNLVLPIPSAQAQDLKSMARELERLSCDLDLDLPARIAFENEQTRSAGVRPAVDGVRVRLHVAPGEPAQARVETTLDMGVKGRLTAEAKVVDLWKSLAEDAVPQADVEVKAENLPTSAIDALAQLGGRLSEGIGPEIALSLTARTSPDSRILSVDATSQRLTLRARVRLDEDLTLRCSGEEGVDLAFDPPAGWAERQIAPFLPEGMQLGVGPGKLDLHVRDVVAPWTGPSSESAARIECGLPSLSWSNEMTRTANAPLGLTDLRVEVQATGADTLTASLRAGLDTGERGTLAVDVTTADLPRWIEFDVLGGLPPTDVKVALDGVSTATLEGLAGQKGRLVDVLGPRLTASLALGWVASTPATLRLDVTSPSTKLAFSGRLEDPGLKCSGDEGLDLTVRIPETFLTRELASFLPEGATASLPGGSASLTLAVRDVRMDEFDSPLTTLDSLACRLNAKLSALGWTDDHTRAAKVEPVLRDLTLAVEVAPKEPLVAKIAALVEAGGPDGNGKLDASVSIDDPWWFLRGEGAPLPPVDAQVKLAGLPTAVLDALTGSAGLVSDLAGPRLDLDLTVERAGPDGGKLAAEIRAPSGSLSFDGRLEKGRLQCSGKEGLALELVVPQRWIDAHVTSTLPAGTTLVLADPAIPVRLHARDLAFALPSGGTGSALAFFSHLALKLDLALPTFAWSDPRIAASGKPAGVHDLTCTVDLTPGTLASASLRASIEGEPPGEISVLLRALDPLESLVAEGGLERFRVAADVRASRVPTGLVDAIAGQDGLLIDTLGPRLDLVVRSDSISLAEGAFTADMSSDQANVHCDRATLKDSVLVLDKLEGKNEALLARIGLTPLASERVVGSLVPMLVNLQKPQGGEPAVIAVDGLRLPLDADLSKLDAVVRLNLGEVSYRLLPGLDAFLGNSEAKLVRLPEIRVPIQKGVASYDALPLRIGGRDLLFHGTFDLTNKTFRMGTSVPLAALGKKVSDKLDSLREFLSPDLAVPIEIRGTWNKPKVAIGDDFLKKVVEDALRKQTESLLEGLLKKKKKE